MAILPIEIEQQASLLPPDDRAKLAGFLLESLQEPIFAGSGTSLGTGNNPPCFGF